MSHISTIKLKVMDLGALGLAATKLGLVLSNQKTYRWYGRWMQDYPLPEGITADQLGKCDYALSIPSNNKAYEVGIKQMPDGSYRLLHDFWNGGYGLQEKIGKDGIELIREYEAQVYRKQMAGQGYELSEIMLADGTRELTATRYV